MEAVTSLFSSVGNWLTHPLRTDYPVWKLMLIFALFLIVAAAIIDNLYIVKDIAESTVETIAEAV